MVLQSVEEGTRCGGYVYGLSVVRVAIEGDDDKWFLFVKRQMAKP
jgi:hypothetical protein